MGCQSRPRPWIDIHRRRALWVQDGRPGPSVSKRQEPTASRQIPDDPRALQRTDVVCHRFGSAQLRVQRFRIARACIHPGETWRCAVQPSAGLASNVELRCKVGHQVSALGAAVHRAVHQKLEGGKILCRSTCCHSARRGGPRNYCRGSGILPSVHVSFHSGPQPLRRGLLIGCGLPRRASGSGSGSGLGYFLSTQSACATGSTRV